MLASRSSKLTSQRPVITPKTARPPISQICKKAIPALLNNWIIAWRSATRLAASPQSKYGKLCLLSPPYNFTIEGNAMPQGYYRQPTLYQDTVVFVSEDDLWSVPAAGGIARRLTSNLGKASRPCFSPDGSQLAFVGSEEGETEIYLMPASGGEARRLTYLGGGLCQH
jgi:tricorn protease-like protein